MHGCKVMNGTAEMEIWEGEERDDVAMHHIRLRCGGVHHHTHIFTHQDSTAQHIRMHMLFHDLSLELKIYLLILHFISA